MKYLLDTHTLIWFLMGDKKLSNKARELIDNPRNGKFISIASLWEIAIKVSLKKLVLNKPFEKLFPEQLHFTTEIHLTGSIASRYWILQLIA